ncbi:efflux RND transporter periplasmic adaptor subunit [Achromobacter spanius]|uniref:EmrA/EmrK family multidrug efflux transporter periplasmic adaptor subunit n=1 Tax=Achromobacter spanius TaxID=217203 RepID=A0A2S0I9B1_9BURK|nr:efflux RND transporter periplasmic adaptor subunit [Achromobacter spanius]AVJ28588.1 EmrA/EmrK family multidrug efflux transporter periplasmic adaptor subunit [Achromobacter spanius]
MKPESTPNPPPSTPRPRGSLARKIAVSGASILAVAVLAGAYAEYSDGRWVSTEDAYVEGNVVQVTPQVGGVVTAIRADNTDRVEAGTVLIELNGVDAQLALDAARANLARSVRQVRGQFAMAGQDGATVALRKVDLARAQEDVSRRSALAKIGAIPGEELVHAQQAVRTARAALDVANEQLKRNHALIDGTTVESHPEVQAAAVQLRNASVALARTKVPAPVGGVVTKRGVQVGQRVAAGAPLMSVVPLDQLWVTANLKESQLRHVRIGQPVKLTTDLYGGNVVYHGRVLGQDAGTGSAFSLLPAQNATGNWIKVVQRVPVRIALDPDEVAAQPLQLGLSMRVEVDTEARDGKRLVAAQGQAQAYTTAVYADELAQADAQVRAIIDANL